MASIGIITCEILELELAHLLSNDGNIEEVIVVENKCSGHFIEAMKKNGSKIICQIPHLNCIQHYQGKDLNVIVMFLSMKLHRSRKILAKTIIKAIQAMNRFVGSLFIGYGLCGTGSINILEYVNKDTPVYFLSDCGQPVDDCIGLLIGGRTTYYAGQCKVPGTFYITPGWSHHWRQMYESLPGSRHEELLKKMYAGYSRILILENPAMKENEIQENIAELNNLLCLTIESRKGTIKLLEDSWKRAQQGIQLIT